jgi:hypothetical protein
MIDFRRFLIGGHLGTSGASVHGPSGRQMGSGVFRRSTPRPGFL